MNNVSERTEVPPPAKPKNSNPMLPEWCINALRPVVRSFSRLLWGVEHKSVENIPLDSGVIIASNHQSYGDPFWLAIPVKRPIRFLAWSEAFSWPVV